MMLVKYESNSMINAFISIIIPVFNGEKYLRDCLNSIRRQTVAEWECICVNDGSSDGSLAILNEFAALDQRFIVVSQGNHGVTIARENGVSHARGEFISFVDCDDVLPENSLEILLRRREEYQAEIVIGNWINVDAALKPLSVGRMPTELMLLNGEQALKYINPFGVLWRSLYSRKLLTPNIWPNPEVKIGEDALALFALLLKSNKVLLIPDGVYLYRQQEESVSHQALKSRRYYSERYLEYTLALDQFICKNRKFKNIAWLQMIVIDHLFGKIKDKSVFTRHRWKLFRIYFRNFILSPGCQKIFFQSCWKSWVWFLLEGFRFLR